LEGGDGGLDDRHAGRGACNVLLFTHARVTAELREPQRLPLVLKTPLGYRQAPLRAPQLEIVTGKLRDDADLRIMKVGLERLVLSPGRRDSMTHSSEQVSFPESVEAGRKGIDGAALVAETGNLFLAVLVGRLDGYGRVAVLFSFVKDGARLGKLG